MGQVDALSGRLVGRQHLLLELGDVVGADDPPVLRERDKAYYGCDMGKDVLSLLDTEAILLWRSAGEAGSNVDGYADYYSNNPRRAGGLRVTQAAWSTGTGEVEAAIQALAEQYEAASTEEVGNYNLVADLFSAQASSTFYNRRTDNPSETTSWIDVGEFLANHTEQGGAAVAAAARPGPRARTLRRRAPKLDCLAPGGGRRRRPGEHTGVSDCVPRHECLHRSRLANGIP